jgi:uncharacterized protein (DUF58 family)
MPDSKGYLHPEAVRRISRLELRARYIVEGFMSGSHRSPWFGQSVEFAQHRPWVAGDDPRNIDWRVWARQDRLYVKQYHEDTNLRCHLLVDVSASMGFGSGPLNKFEYAATIAATLAWLILKQHDAVGGMTFDSHVRSRIPVSSRRRHLAALVDVLRRESPHSKSDLARVLGQAALSFPRRGQVVVISDFLCDTEGTLRGLRMLRSQGHDVMVFHVLDDEELDFSLEGPVRFESMESGSTLRCNPKALRDGYLEALNTFLDELRRGCATEQVDYTLVRTSEPLDAVLPRFLGNRRASIHRN